MKARILIFLIALIMGCKDEIQNPCNGDCLGKIKVDQGIKDKNGFIHKVLDSGYYSYFAIYIEASDVKPEYQYGGRSVVSAQFDTDTYWSIEDTLAVRIPLYYGFGGLKSSPYWTATKLPVKNKLVYLSQYAGFLVPIVQGTEIYLEEYQYPSPLGYKSEYTPDPGDVWGKRMVGPIPKDMKGDTIKIFTKIFWEAGSHSIGKDGYITQIILE